MTITKCDRCGAEMSTIGGDYSVKVTDNNLLFPEKMTNTFDLCSNCANILIKDFMRGEWKDD